MRLGFIILLFINAVSFSEDYITLYNSPPERNTAHINYEKLKQQGIYEMSYKVMYKSYISNKSDTLIWVIKKWNDTFGDFVAVKEFHKDSVTHRFNEFDEEVVKSHLLTLKKYKKYRTKKNNVSVDYSFNPFSENVCLQYNLMKPQSEYDSVLSVLRDSMDNIILVKAYNYIFNDSVVVQYQYNYNDHSGKSYEYFQGKKYLRSVITLSHKNQVVKENLYMFDYLKTDYKTMLESNPYQSYIYEYSEDNLVKAIRMITAHSEISYLHSYK